MKKTIVGLIALMILLMSLSIVSAQIDEDSVEVYLDNVLLEEGNDNAFQVVERGETLDLKVVFKASNTTDPDEIVEISGEIKGDDHDDIIADETDTFDLNEGGRYIKRLKLKLTDRMDVSGSGQYDLRVNIDGRTRDIAVRKFFRLKVETPQHAVKIDDIIFSPMNKVKAGRALLTTVRVENDGDRNEDGVKIVVSIPELGLSAASFIDQLEKEGQDDDSTESEPMYIRIPDCAEAGLYTVKVDVYYDDGDERVSEETSIDVIAGDACELDSTRGGNDNNYNDQNNGQDQEPQTRPAVPQTVITVGAQSQDLQSGAGGAIYPITLTNNGPRTKTYTVAVDTASTFADVRVSPSNVLVVGAGETKSAFIFVSAKPGVAAGQYGFSVTISSNNEVLQQVPLTANVVGGAAKVAGSNLKRALEIGLIVLVVILVILGLIIGFNKLRSDEEESKEESTQTYY